MGSGCLSVSWASSRGAAFLRYGGRDSLIVVFWKWWDHRRAAFNLADAAEDDFGTAVIHFDGSSDFNRASGEAADIADIFRS